MVSRTQGQSSKSTDVDVPGKQRALVLQGGGALGAYEVGVIKQLAEELTKADKKSSQKSKIDEDKLLFDIVAGTSVGAINAAVLVSNVVKEKGSWKLAINRLEDFWTNGLASNPKVFYPNPAGNILQLNASDLPWWQPWSEKWQQNKNMKNIASEEAARRYYSTKLIQTLGAEHIYSHPTVRHDYKFFDPDNKWYIYNNTPLRETIKNFAKFPIATDYKENQPRLLITSVDIAEGKTIIFDSYKKADGTRKTEYYLEDRKKKEIGSNKKNKTRLVTLRYDNGIALDHVMASGTLPGVYDPMEIENREFWDGGLLSNTPFRELLQSHRDYWVNVEGQEKAPDLDVYIVNVHTPTIPIEAIPKYYDEVQDRSNDIIFGDRSSGYDQYTANLITDYIDFINDLKKLAVSHIKDHKEIHKFEYEFEKLKSKDAKSTFLKNNRKHQKYRDLLKGRFALTKIERIERKYSRESTSRKTADFSHKTINALIKEGEDDVKELL